MIRHFISFWAWMLFCSIAIGQNKDVVSYSMDILELSKNKQKIMAKDTSVMPAYRQLIKDAENALEVKPMSVMEKKNNPPSGNKHDYMSLAPYYWPDPTKENGIPYIRKDGQINPEVEEYKDKEYLPVLCRLIQNLSLAYYFSDNTKYAEKCAQLIKVWFLDIETKMNPNLNYGQMVKGVNDGRGAGIIDTRFFIKVVDAIGIIQHSNYWSKEDHEGMVNWFKEYLEWLRTSKNGIEEKKSKNNHGIWYDAQALSFALFINDQTLVKEIINSVQKRLEIQMDSNGFFPAELERTISLHYSVFVLEPLLKIAQMSSWTNVDMWNYTTSSGKSIKKAFETLLPYMSNEKEWEKEQIKPFDFQVSVPLMAQAIHHLDCKSCKEYIQLISGEKSKKLLITLLHNLD
jgi:hypothetical protein